MELRSVEPGKPCQKTNKLPESEFVSVVIPCYNEERFIVKALEQLAGQYEKSRFEIIVVDGMSEDRTRDLVSDFKANHPDLSITIIDNPARRIPTALNLGVSAAHAEIIARMDAHAVPSEGYIRRCVEVLGQHNAGVVGMPCRVRAGTNTLLARAIANAVSHPFGIGDAKYRLSKGAALQEQVDTVAFACFRKSLWKELGGFNESLLTNEDYDFNYRVRLAGLEVILDRSGHCDYFARTSFRDLAAQYRRYGGWKARMIRLHPRSIKARHLVAPAFVLSLVGLLILSVFWPPFALLLSLEIGLYVLLSLAFGWQIMRRNNESLGTLLVLPLVFLTIHLTWGTSFLLGLVREPG
ncbi:MAG TPA: glycosyltransferase family 2 protein [Blastocatellia bacterium]|nr:glycosyltransferase family 2 protein [Blastocatellia bacterium]